MPRHPARHSARTWILPSGRWAGAVTATLAVAVGCPGAAVGAAARVACGLDDREPTVVEGSFAAADAKSIRMVPFRVPRGTTRVEVAYRWDDLPPVPADERDRSTVDLGLWDADGVTGPAGFRGWSGDREGRLDRKMDPVWVQAGSAERGYLPGVVEPGIWNVQLGAGGVAPGGVSYHVEISCHSARSRPDAPADERAPRTDPVDPTHVANPSPGWYLGDFHLHAYHSNPKGLAGPKMAEVAIAKGLDIIPVTEYVTTAHWSQLGATQRAHPDVLIWPGREIITYHGHMIVLGETPSTVEFRPGFDGVTAGDIQRRSIADGALFGVAHPTVFPPDQFGNTCRGCFFELGDQLDWDSVDTMELHTGDVPQSPFTATAVQLWESKLAEGHRITGVSGSDDKLGDDYGATATAVYAEQLSRVGVSAALRAGHAYVIVRGTADPTRVTFDATAPDGSHAIYGDTLVADSANAKVQVTGGRGQELDLVRNGRVVRTVTVDADPFTLTVDLDRERSEEGPLGTFWRIQTREGTQLTTIGNPIFLADRARTEPQRPTPTVPAGVDRAGRAVDTSADRRAGPAKQESGGGAWAVAALGLVVVAAAAATATVRARRRRS